jgi:Resolvase, N terminal domain
MKGVELGAMQGYPRTGRPWGRRSRHLTAAGAAKMFRQAASGAKTDRAQLRKVLAEPEADDVLMVTRLDRLARSTRDLLNTLAAIAERKAGFRSLSDTWADTTTAHGRLMLTVLGGLAEFEHELIRARTGEGRDRAKANGVRLGRKPTLTHHQQGGFDKAAEIESFLYMSYWYGGLYVVIEGWQELSLSDAVIDATLQSPNVDLLRRYRNGVFHFQRDYNDERFLAFMQRRK